MICMHNVEVSGAELSADAEEFEEGRKPALVRFDNTDY